jgi:ABC-type Fe3+/spermidine/putrescine transport system ATPase subunit
LVELKGISVRVGGHRVLRDITFSAPAGEIFALLGPSGSGKTTLLRAVAGLAKPEAGEISVHGRTVSAPDVLVPPFERGMSMIFQDLALWPHMSASENIAFMVRSGNRQDCRKRVDELLGAMGLGGLRDRYPDQLSGGQRQRLAIARALASGPECLLMDEPFSSLDDLLRSEMLELTRRLRDEQGLSVLYVTHNVDEALDMADTVAVLRDGSLMGVWRNGTEGAPERKDILGYFREDAG